jgi:hypothetical protein
MFLPVFYRNDCLVSFFLYLLIWFQNSLLLEGLTSSICCIIELKMSFLSLFLNLLNSLLQLQNVNLNALLFGSFANLQAKEWSSFLHIKPSFDIHYRWILIEKILLKQVRWCLTFVGLYIHLYMNRPGYATNSVVEFFEKRFITYSRIL